MTEPAARKRLLWLGGGVCAIALLLLVVPSLLPDAHPGESASPAIRTSAESNTSTAPSAGTPIKSGGGTGVASLALRIGLVIVIVAAAVVGLRWWGRRQSSPRSLTGFIRIVDTLAINNARSIHLVALGERVVAVGATAQQLSLLVELDPDEASEVLETSAQRDAQKPIADFASELFQSLRRPSRPSSTIDVFPEFEEIGR